MASGAEMVGTIGAQLRTLQQAQAHVLSEIGRDDVTGPQLSVLGAVVSNPGINQRGVADLTFIDKSTVTSIVSNLAGRDLLRNSRNRLDGRHDHLEATPAAIELVYTSSPRLVEGNDALLATLAGDGRDAFLLQLSRLAYADQPAPPERYTVPSPDGVRPQLKVTWGLGRTLRGSMRRYNRIWADHLDGTLTLVQHLTLDALTRGHELDQRALGAHLSLGKATLTVVLDRLERRDLVRRRRDASDGRRRVIELTDAGRALLAQAGHELSAIDDDFLAPLPAEQRPHFLDALAHLVALHSRVQDTERPALPSPT